MTESATVAFFSPYQFEVGQKIRISGGPRHGDWEVIGCTDRQVVLRCPVSKREFSWDRFCYFVKDEDGVRWPG